MRRDLKSEPQTILKTEKEKGLISGLKTAGCYTLGAINILGIPGFAIAGCVTKGIGLPFDENSKINKVGDIYFEAIKSTPKFFNEIPERVKETIITGSETKYDIYDEETIYYSNGEVEKRMINIRHQVVSN